MNDITFEHLLEATRTLHPAQRQALAEVLRFAPLPEAAVDPFIDLLVESDVLNEAGAFSVFAPLSADHPAAGTVSDAELIAASQCISCEWDEETLQD